MSDRKEIDPHTQRLIDELHTKIDDESVFNPVPADQIPSEVVGILRVPDHEYAEPLQLDKRTVSRLAFEQRLRKENPHWRRKKIRFTPAGTALNAVVIREEKPT